MTSEKLKPTPGPWQVIEKPDDKMISSWSIQMGEHSIAFFPYAYQYADEKKTCGGYVSDPEIHANARLIAEAGTVHHECGLSPRELLVTAQELYESLRETAEALEHFENRMALRVNPPTLENARAALTKHKEV